MQRCWRTRQFSRELKSAVMWKVLPQVPAMGTPSAEQGSLVSSKGGLSCDDAHCPSDERGYKALGTDKKTAP